MVDKISVEKLAEDANNGSRKAVDDLIDIVLNIGNDIEVRRLAWKELEGIYHSAPEDFAEWADRRVMQRGARYPG